MHAMIDILAQAADSEGSSIAADLGGVVMDVIHTFHIYWQLFFSQVVSFLIVAWLLKKFAFGPVQKMLEARRQRIAEGEEKLKQIERQLAESEKTTAAAIAKAHEDATRLIEEARESAAILSEKKAQEAVSQAQAILAKAETAAKAEREQIASELRKEFGRLVTTTTAQVTGKVLTQEDQRRINQEALTKI